MVISTVNQVIYNGDGSTVAWPYTFRIIDDTDIKLTLIDSDETETAITSDYYVDVTNNTVYYPWYAPGAEPPEEDQPPKVASGQKLLIYRELPVTQTKDLGEKWPFATIELGLDKLTMILQQVLGWWDRCLHISPADEALHPGFDMTFPIEAGKSFRVNSTATGFEASDDPGTSAAAAIAAAATATAAATAAEAAAALVDVQAVWFDSVSDMRDADIPAGITAGTKGYYAPNDGGGATYFIREADSDTDDGGSIIILDNGNVAELIIVNDTVNVHQFGAVGDGVTDDTTSIQNAVAMHGTVVFGNALTYNVTSSVYIQRNTTIDLNGSTVLLNDNNFMNCKTGEDSLVYNGHGNITITNGTLVNGEILLAHGKDIKVTFVNMKNSPGHFMQIMSCSDVLISNCYLCGMADSASHNDAINLDPCDYSAFKIYGSGSPAYDGTNNVNITIENCTSVQGSDTGYTKSQALGVSHYHVNNSLYHENVIVRNNYVENDNAFNGMILFDLHNSLVEDNVINGQTTAITLSYCEDVVIKGNVAKNTRGYFASMLWGNPNHDLSIYDNEYAATNMINATGTVTEGNITFVRVDPFVLSNAEVDQGSDNTLSFPYTCFNNMRLGTGVVISGTYSEDIYVRSYGSTNFAASDSYHSIAGNCNITFSNVTNKNVITCNYAEKTRRVWGWLE